jgi:transposase
MLADVVDAVIGIDTHTDTHAVAVCTAAGVVLAEITVTADPGGHAEVLAVAAEHAPGPRLAFAVEGTRSHGIGLARVLQAAGMLVIEVERPSRSSRRGKGKSDPIDARLAARTALGYDAARLPTPRTDGTREALRIALTARRDMSDERTAKVNALRALLRSGDPSEATLAAGPLPTKQLQTITARRGPRDHTRDTPEAAARRAEARRLTQRIMALDADLAANKTYLSTTIEDLAPGLLTRPGIGPVSAAQAIVSWSHPGRVRNDAAFAALAGASPLPASSGRTTRHRLNRGGDRQLNRALHTIATTRMRDCPRTRTYLTRRRAEGRTDREIRRCLKRYIARELHRTLTHTLDNT